MDTRRWPVSEERLLTVHSLLYEFLKARKVTVVWIECDNDAISRMSTRNCFFKKKKIL